MTYQASSFDQDVFLLSASRHIRDVVPSSPPRSDQHVKHVLLLDDVALILTLKAKGDVCAVTWRLTQYRIDVYFSKNSPTCKYLQGYLSEICSIIASSDPPQIQEERLLMLILKTCLEKVRSRMQKLQKAVRDYPEVLIFPNVSKSLSTQRQWRDMDDGQVAFGFLMDIQAMDLSMESLREKILQVADISQQALIIGKLTIMNAHPILQRRLQKLSSYYRAVIKFITHLHQTEYEKYRGNIFFTEIPTFTPVIFSTPINTLDLLNENASRLGFDNVTKEDFMKQFPEFKNKQGNMQVTISCHCEINIALYALKSSHRSIQIGVSKGLCFLCQKFMEFFTKETAIPVFVSQNQGKIHAGWMLPDNASDSMKEQMKELVKREINEIREGIIKRKRSDSFPAGELEPTEAVALSREFVPRHQAE